MRQWHYETATDLDQSLVERLRRFPREPDMLIYGLRTLIALAIRAWLRLYHRLEIVGRDHLPSDGSFVLVANHSSHLDALCLLSALPLRKLHRAFPAAAQDYFFVSVPRLAIAAVVVNALPFDRQVHRRHSLNLCRQLLANPGSILVIFPEGTRSTTGKIDEFKPGIGILLAGLPVPVVPYYLKGAFEAWPKGCLFPRPHRIRLTIGVPRNYALFPPGRESALRICSELRETVEELVQRGPSG